jgi:phage/plasmid-associated DNA primase
MCKYLKMLAGKIFIYIGKKIYCFNGKTWKQDDILIKHFLSNELYEFLKMILVELYFDHKDFNSMKSQIKRLKTANFKKDVVESYREIGTDDKIIFDYKWNLLGFNNIVYDLEEECFREYKYDDYVSTTTGYDWIEPTEEEIYTLKGILREIMPVDEEYELYLQILASTINGKCLEKFIIFSGTGGNGKGLVDDLLLVALGNYGMIGNNSILFETSKTGPNPEKANMHKKRLVVFREPPESKKFENSIIKELTGGGTFSARGLNDSDTKKEINLTMIVECNKKPMFNEEPTNADVRRIIDINFRTTYTTDDSLIDEKNHIYKANPYYKSFEFQQKYKYALIKILIEEHKKYKKNNFIVNLPKSISERTQNYLDLSYSIVKWFKETYEHTKNTKDYIKIKDLYSDFTQSIYFSVLSKNEKAKYNKKYFSDYIENNVFFKKYYVDRLENVRSIVQQWKKIKEDDDY